MTSFAVDLELLAELVERMAAFERHAAAFRNEVDVRLRRLHGAWSGAAAAASATAHAEWTAGAGQMHEALGVLRAIAATAGENYAAAARANALMWSL